MLLYATKNLCQVIICSCCFSRENSYRRLFYDLIVKIKPLKREDLKNADFLSLFPLL